MTDFKYAIVKECGDETFLCFTASDVYAMLTVYHAVKDYPATNILTQGGLSHIYPYREEQPTATVERYIPDEGWTPYVRAPLSLAQFIQEVLTEQEESLSRETPYMYRVKMPLK